MAAWEYLWRLLLMAVLLAGSAFFSGSETAFFHLSQRQISLFSRSNSRAEKLAALILQRPGRFLTCLLFGNMLVNVAYFTLSGILYVMIIRDTNPAAALLFAGGSLLILVLFGEMLPKSLAYSNAGGFCRWTSIPNYALLRSLGPLLAGVEVIIVRPLCRLMLGSVDYRKPAPKITDVRILLESSLKRGLLTAAENQLLMEVLKLGYLKVRHVMVPRVDMPAIKVDTAADEIIKYLSDHNLKKVPVYESEIEEIIGVLYYRDLLLHRGRPVRDLLRPAVFVPEQKSLESLLNFFRDKKIDFALVVDEYGGIAGCVELEEILNELFGTEEPGEEIEPIQTVGPMQYRLAADLPVHEWLETFALSQEENRYATVGGLVTALLGRVARPGDRVQWKNMKFTVETMHKNRIRTLLLDLESPSEKEME